MKRTDGRGGEAGFTLVELLVALAITAMIASFVLGGLDYARRAWAISRDREAAGEVDAAAMQLRALLARTMPATTIDEDSRLARLVFAGSTDSLTFVTLSEATAFRGGLMRVRLSWQDRPPVPGRPASLVLATAVFRANPRLVVEAEPVVLFRRVAALSLQYFGTLELGKPPQWQSQWLGRDRTPLLVLAEIDLAGNGGTRRLVLPIPLRVSSEM